MTNTKLLLALGVLLVCPALVFDSPYLINLGIIALSYAVITSNWDVLFGCAGVWSFGQLGFLGIGLYTTAILTTFYQVSPWLAIVIGCVLSALAGAGIGVVTLRLRGVYLALVTVGFMEILTVIIINFFTFSLGTTYRVIDIPPLQIQSMTFDQYNGLPYFYTAIGIFLLSTFANRAILKSRIGLAFRAMRDSEARARSLGVNTTNLKLLSFLVSAIFTSMIGSFYAHYYSLADTDLFSWSSLTINFIIMTIGGWGTFYGPMIASMIWVFLDQALELTGLWRELIEGLIVIILLILVPRGIMNPMKRGYSYVLSRLTRLRRAHTT
jgi:branched-chain amino acid transport system permease protein